MTRLLPRSLIGQMALAVGLLLLLVQALNLMALRSERQRVTQAQLEGPVVSRFLVQTARLIERGGPGPVEGRRGRVELADTSLVAPEAADAELSDRLRENAAANGLEIRDARAAISDTPPPIPANAGGERGRGRQLTAEERQSRLRALILSVQLPDGRWVNGNMAIARAPSPPLLRLAAWTLIFYLVLLAVMVLVLVRLLRPLRELTRAAEKFRGGIEAPPLRPRGPSDIRRAMEAFNAMRARVTSLLDEKDRMLGAIGHDLRTPLASLRIRAESVEPEEERERMITTIEEMTGLLDGTLALARSGRSQEPARQLDVGALADAVVEEFRELGQPVTFVPGSRTVAAVRPNLLRGALRNLIDNCVKYSGATEVTVSSDKSQVRIEVRDRGPGIPEEHLEMVQEPFVRLEGSRSRETGGTGLGIALARAAAQLHGGNLELSNRPEGGLSAIIALPCG